MQQVVSLAEGAAVHFAIRTKLRIGVTPGLKAPAPPSPQTVSPHSPRRKCVSRCLGTKGVFFFWQSPLQKLNIRERSTSTNGSIPPSRAPPLNI